MHTEDRTIKLPPRSVQIDIRAWPGKWGWWNYRYGRPSRDDPLGQMGAHSLIIVLFAIKFTIEWGTRIHERTYRGPYDERE